MTMRNYFVTIHKDGHVTVQEYEEPKEFAYPSGEGKAVRDAYNQALLDVVKILDAEKVRCTTNSKIKKFGQEWVTSWDARFSECDLLTTSIATLVRKS